METHPIIKAFFETDEQLHKILEKNMDRNQYLENVFFKLLTIKYNETIDEKLFLEIDQAIIKGHPDVNVYLFFIFNAISYALRFKQYERARSLLSLLTSVSQNDLHQIIQALSFQANAILKKIDGEIQESKELMKKSLAKIDRNSPRFRMLLRNFATLLSSEGRLEDLNPADIKYLDDIQSAVFIYEILEIKIMNHIITGNYNKGFELIEQFQKNNQNQLTDNLEVALNLFRVVSGDLEEANYLTDEIKILARVFKDLANGNINETQNNYQLLQKYIMGNKRPVIDEYVLLHLEFLKNNKGMVRLMLKERENNNIRHYLDDLFYGRLCLLENDREGANQAFTRLNKNIRHYDAMHRLIFELQFVKEMSLPDIILLTHGWQPKKQFVPNKVKPVSELPKQSGMKGIDLLVGKSRQMQRIKEIVKKYSPLSAPILITGETGTGKELVARAIHEEGQFSKEAFLAINCGALTESLLQSELFGYVAGAFTGAQKERKGIFEAAGKGTVFLDEFGDISPQLQVSLLRVLESNEIRMIGGTVTRKIECRLVIATNIDLHQVVNDKKFREDLFFRLTKLEIKLPALRERAEDIPELINYFLRTLAKDSSQLKNLTPELFKALSEYHWPGNIRELKNEIERLFILNPDRQILGIEQFDFNHLQEPPSITPKAQTQKRSGLPPQQNNDYVEDPVLKILQKGFPVEQRHNQIKDLFKKYKKLTKGQIIEFIKIGHTTAGKDLQVLIDQGFIVRRSPTNSTRTDYFEIATETKNESH